jgi:hypothetical protein
MPTTAREVIDPPRLLALLATRTIDQRHRSSPIIKWKARFAVRYPISFESALLVNIGGYPPSLNRKRPAPRSRSIYGSSVKRQVASKGTLV